MGENLNSAKEMLADASSLIIELEKDISKFFMSKPYKTIVEHNSKTRADTHKIKLTQEIPGQFRSKARHIASDIRSSLDHVGFAAALAQGKANPRKTYFPFAKADTEESNVRKGNCKDIPQEIFDVFWGFRPFIGGDDVLWALNEIANCNKHRSVVPVGHGLGGQHMMKNFKCDGLCHEMAFPPRWDAANNEAILCIVDSSANTTYDIRLSFDICFGDISVVKGYPVVNTLRYLHKKANEIILASEVKGKQLGYFA